MPAVHSYSVALAYQLVFVCDKPFKSNRTTRVEFAGANSQLGPKAIAETIRKSRRSIQIDSGRINLSKELLACAIILTDDCVRVMRSISVYVIDSLIYRVNNFNR